MAALLRLKRLEARDLAAQQIEINTRPASFVTPSQTLSLRFGSALPDKLIPGREYSVRLCVSNEFGLWTREHLSNEKGGGDVSVQCELLSLIENGNASSFLSSSESILGGNGRADVVFTLHQSAVESGCEECVMLQFSCTALPSGQVVAPIVSLPLFVPPQQDAARSDAHSGDSRNESDSESGGEKTRELRQIISQCSQLSGQSVKIFDPHSSAVPSSVPVVSAVSSDTSVGVSMTRSGLIYALECPGSLGIGGTVSILLPMSSDITYLSCVPSI